MVKCVRECRTVERRSKDYYLLALSDLLGLGILESFERVKQLSASERSLRDTIRGVQIRADAVSICICNSTGRSEIRDKFHEC